MRTRVTLAVLAALHLYGANCLSTRAASPQFSEVYDLVRTQLSGISESDLNRAAVQGLISQLAPRVTLADTPATETKIPALITQSNVLEEAVVYLRVGQVQAGLSDEIARQMQALGLSGRLKGVILDLRYAGGADYQAAAAVVEGFLSEQKPVLDWGEGVFRSAAKSNAVTAPVAVLINGQTAEAAEALAAAVRDTGVGLVLGNTTAGRAWRFKEFELKNGERLRIAQGPVLVGTGSAIPETGVKPDIMVTVKPQDELAFFADPYRMPNLTNAAVRAAPATNNVRRAGVNEADLVRERRGGNEPEVARRLPPEKPIIRDPVLGRAVDLLKGLAVVRQTRS